MSWNPKQEQMIIDALVSKPANQQVLADSLLKGKNKRHFTGKSVRGIVAKARSLSYEALLNDVLLVMPPPAPKPKKKTAADIRKEMFAKMPKMTSTQKTSKSVIEAVKEAKAAIAKREAAAKKAKASRAKKK
tara:strand:+ start:3816 stop:4211 length:396 start_codon:yes stop_codon:yes gene_type:complete